jgi:hypothetical protein
MFRGAILEEVPNCSAKNQCRTTLTILIGHLMKEIDARASIDEWAIDHDGCVQQKPRS